MNKDKAMQEVDRFDTWLRNIKNVHYANSSKMSDAYQIVYDNAIQLQQKHELKLIT